jgi:hypothetical protein
MAMKLSEVQAKVKVATITWDDETVDVGYAPARFTPEVLEAVTEAESANNLSILGKMLEPILDWWDVLDDKDKRIPTTAENIAKMPLAFLMKVLGDLQDDMTPPASKD